MPLTPRMIVLAARGGLAMIATGTILAAGADAAMPSPLLLVAISWAVSHLALLSFPRIRKNDLLVAVGGCGAIAGYLTASDKPDEALIAALAGIAGPIAVALTLSMMRVRTLAGSNWHMPFVEWREVDRRRRRMDRQLPAPQPESIQIDS